MTDLTALGVAAIRDGFRRGDFSAREVATAFNANVASAKTLNAFIVETPDHALAAADQADKDRAAGTFKPLSGVPIGMKDLFCTKGVQTTAASHILEGFIPQYESTVSSNLWAAGAGMLGKLNMDQFAMGSSNETSYFGNVISPLKRKIPFRSAQDRADFQEINPSIAIDPFGEFGSLLQGQLTPGGSSGGSAAAVAAALCPAATGTDTGGSIRQPAAFTGISGIKPTYGRCSRWGVIAFASSLDQAGPMANDVRDCAIMLEAMAGFDAKDATSLNLPVPNWEEALSGDLRGKRVGIPREYGSDGINFTTQHLADPDGNWTETTQSGLDYFVAKMWADGIKWLKEAGAEIVNVSLPHTKYALPAYYIIAPAECSSNLARYDGVRYGLRDLPDGAGLQDMYAATRAAGFGDEVKRRIMIGTYVLSAGFYDAYFTQASKVRTLIAQDFDRAWEQCDLLLTPTAPSAAFALGEKSADPLAMYLNDVFTVPSSLAGLPAMSVPAGVDGQGLPLGLQIIGKALDEQSVLNASLAIEERAGFTARAGKWW
jgi:aspartyl-tRNA(Asn)/glutamyl-tRNA(Gln) amidotransferase subunit A